MSKVLSNSSDKRTRRTRRKPILAPPHFRDNTGKGKPKNGPGRPKHKKDIPLGDYQGIVTSAPEGKVFYTVCPIPEVFSAWLKTMNSLGVSTINILVTPEKTILKGNIGENGDHTVITIDAKKTYEYYCETDSSYIVTIRNTETISFIERCKSMDKNIKFMELYIEENNYNSIHLITETSTGGVSRTNVSAEIMSVEHDSDEKEEFIDGLYFKIEEPEPEQSEDEDEDDSSGDDESEDGESENDKLGDTELVLQFVNHTTKEIKDLFGSSTYKRCTDVNITYTSVNNGEIIISPAGESNTQTEYKIGLVNDKGIICKTDRDTFAITIPNQRLKTFCSHDSSSKVNISIYGSVIYSVMEKHDMKFEYIKK